MVLTFILLYTIAATIYLNNKEKDWAKWISLLCFSFGSGAFGKSLVESFFPYWVTYNLVEPSFEYLFQVAYSVGSFLNQAASPYFFIMFVLTYCGSYSTKRLKMFGFLFLIPLLVLIPNTTFYPKIEHNYILLACWGIFCFGLGSVYLIYCSVKEKNRALKKERKFINFLIVPPVLANIVTNYIGHAIGLTTMWRLNAIPVVLVTITLIAMVTKFGILGIRLRLEKQAFGNTMKAVSSGTAILNHTIKNEIGKIFILSDRIKYVAAQNDQGLILRDVDTILDSTSHMLSMVDRIQQQSQEIILKPDYHLVYGLIESSIEMTKPYLLSKNIEVIRNIKTASKIYSDNVHLQEVFRNLIKNAVEAMGNGGQLRISAFETRKAINVEFQDNGSGIDSEVLNHIFQPYFTTKNRSLNFGLGLSYCINVLQKHNGVIDVRSQVGEGTTFSLQFPIKRRAVTKD
ncbi:sensor histidine kinase [Paenibacillus sp. Soil522]|uniref:sensor histidine kinase n=1 Tax=Paenibacillus sp. Soil522 TaxID=1736388 RepID=UPI0006FE7CE9|nr:HAMP domain-containing sensor histidine kinase [Paenibacillus sp. Soil522]KRE45493.1 hypothetical protein ASG81_12825 [Paenibacillus sp. Soil522]